MQVQYYHPHLLYHYAPPTHAAMPQPPPPPPPHPYFAFPLILPQHQHQQRHQQQTQPSQAAAAAAAAAAAFFAQQQQLAGLALHFQALSVGSGSGGGSSSRGGSSSSGGSSPYDGDRVRSASFGQPDYTWKLLTWLKTHRMHKYFERLRKYSFEQLLNLDRETLETEQFTQGAIKKLLGMLDRVRQDRGAFDSPSRGAGSPPGFSQPPHHQRQLHIQQQLPPALPPPPPHQRTQHGPLGMFPPQHPVHHHHLVHSQQQQQQGFLCSQH